MSNDENSTKSGAVSNIVSKLMALKESNPKVFFGAIGGIVLLILIVILSGGDKKSLPVTSVTNIVPGQTYTLRVVNSYDPASTVRLVAIPGSMAAYDDTDAEDRVGGCKHLLRGTKVKALQFQTSSGVTYVNVKMISGECNGQKGWVISSNLE